MLRDYQKDAVNWMAGRESGALFADPGTGKTLIVLTLLRRLRMLGAAKKVLLVAPIRVLYNVWPLEIEKWGFDFSYSILHGGKKDKALLEDTDIHLINAEGLKWLMTKEARPDYETFILDESSLFRNPTSKRMRLLQKALPYFDKRFILTGTPTPNGIHDLWSQMFIVDLGKTLGKNITAYRNAYFRHEVHENIHRYFPLQNSEKTVWGRVASSCFRIDANTCLDLPDLLVNDILVDLPAPALADYKQMEKKMFFEIDGKKRFAWTSGSKYGMCRQMAGGALYNKDDRNYEVLHKAKLQALDELRNELGKKPLLVVFCYRHEAERLQDHLGTKDYCPCIAGGSSERHVSTMLRKWNAGELPLLLVQAQSISHGLNMQAGGNDIVWYTLTDDYDVYEQLNRRLYRSGVQGSVRIHRLIAKGTIDQAVKNMLEKKRDGQQGLFEALKDYRAASEGGN